MGLIGGSLLLPGRGGGGGGLRPQDVFAASIYTGTGAAQDIVTGFQPDFVWVKSRTNSFDHRIVDAVRGLGKELLPNLTNNEDPGATTGLTAFKSNGFSIGSFVAWNQSGTSYVAWPLKRAPKFFDVVTYTGDGTSGRQIAHALGIAPGMILLKKRNSSSGSYWLVYHVGLPSPASDFLILSETGAKLTNNSVFGAVATSSVFTVGTDSSANNAGDTYVAYLFAHDPDTVNGIIQCGSFTTSGGATTVNLGWMPQYLETKRVDAASDWRVFDAARGWGAASANFLRENASDTESAVSGDFIHPTATGLSVKAGYPAGTYIFRAIRAPIT